MSNTSGYELVDIGEACRILGGNSPIDPSAFYRGIRAKKYPAPIKVGCRSRWLKSECEAVVRKLIEKRDAGRPIPGE